jgi:O-antigen/teichoic acid export membrane protein
MMANRRNRARLIPLAFILCGVFDFIWGYIHEHSVAAGVVAVVLGLFGTAWYLFLIGGWNEGD